VTWPNATPHPNTLVVCDLAEQSRRYVTPRVKRDGRSSAIRVPVLPVRASLTRFHEPEPLEGPGHLAWLQDGNRTHTYATWMTCTPTNSASSFGSPSSRSISATS
jgi:hypothetical protein